MSGPYREVEVRLQRDAFNTPWGFRLQGGKDFNAPLSVQRVFVGSPSQTELQRGDVILNIENYDVTVMTHKQAQDIIRKSGGTLYMNIKRGPQSSAVRSLTPQTDSQTAQFFRSRSLESGLVGPSGVPTGTLGFIPTPRPQMAAPARNPTYGVDYTRPRPQHPQQQFAKPVYGQPQRGPTYPSSMLNRLNQSLNDRLFVSGSDDMYNGAPGGGSYGGSYVGDRGGEDFYDAPRRPHSQQASASYNSPQYQPEDAEPYERKSVNELRGVYNKPWKQNQTRTEQTAEPSSTRPKSGPEHQEHPDTSSDMGERYQMGEYSMPRSPRESRRIWTRPEDGLVSSGLKDPGWDPRMAQQERQQQQAQQRWRPVQAPMNIGYAQTHANPPPPAINARQQQPPGVRHIQYEAPAWKGSLKSSGAVRPWEVQAATLAAQGGRPYSPTGADGRPASPHGPATVQPHKPRLQTVTYSGTDPVYSQQSNPTADSADGAKVVHLQYNSPLQMYSRSNVDDALRSQTTGMPGEGTMQVSGGQMRGPNGQAQPQQDFTQSDLARMIHQEDARAAGRGRPTSPYRESARNIEFAPGQEMQYHGFQDQARQSPSMYALQHNVIEQPEQQQQGPGGSSDF